MKKTFPININSTVVYIDEDAYEQLNNYLDLLRKTFTSPEGEEIVMDIESRISELFAERIEAGAKVISIDDVTKIIEQMGKPADIGAEIEDENKAETTENGNTAKNTTPPPFPYTAAQSQPVKKLYRNMKDKVFSGVIGGLATYLGWNSNIMRVLIVFIFISTVSFDLGGLTIIAYLIAWMTIPAAVTPRQILEMTGTPVNIATVGNTILGTSESGNNTSGAPTFQTILTVIGKTILGFLGFIGGAVCIGMIGLFIMATAALIMYSAWGDISLLHEFEFTELTPHPILGAIGIITLSLSIMLPAASMLWAGCCAIFNTKGASNTTIISAVIVEVLLILATIILLNLTHHEFCHSTICAANSFSTLLLA